MIFKKLVWCALVCSWVGTTQVKATNNYTLYTVTEDDNDERIAKKLTIKLSSLHKANPHINWNRMRPGSKIKILHNSSTKQQISSKSEKRSTSSHSGNYYVVTDTDDDLKIARKVGIKLRTLHELNSSVNWNRIGAGLKLNIPSPAQKALYHSKEISSQKEISSPSGNYYVVTETDDDLKIARKVGIKLRTLHGLNPSVNWNRMGAGLKLKIPSSNEIVYSSQEAPLASKGPSDYRIKKIRTNRAKTCCDDVTIRSQPSVNGIQLTQVEFNSAGKILDRENGWYKIRFKKDIEGWVRGDMLEPYQTINSPKFSKKRIEKKSFDTLVSKTKKRKFRIRRKRNSGIIMTEKDFEGITDPSIINSAKQYLGVRYRFSGTSSRGFDCSGFTSHVYKRHGISLPHSSRKQSGRGKKVSSSQLKTGDLVFFKTNGRTRVNHVGIYVGNGKFIHASSGGGKVQVNKLNEGYYSRRFAGGRRVK